MSSAKVVAGDGATFEVRAARRVILLGPRTSLVGPDGRVVLNRGEEPVVFQDGVVVAPVAPDELGDFTVVGAGGGVRLVLPKSVDAEVDGPPSCSSALSCLALTTPTLPQDRAARTTLGQLPDHGLRGGEHRTRLDESDGALDLGREIAVGARTLDARLAKPSNDRGRGR